METKREQGVITLTELKEMVEKGDIETVIVAFCDMQGRLVGKRLTGRYFLEHANEGGAHFCVYLLATDMAMNTPSGFPSLGWEQGYGDWVAKPDLRTLRIIPWHEKTALVLSDAVDHQGELVEVAPRSVLKRQLARAQSLGFTLNMASELEFYLLRETYETAYAKNYADLSLAGHYNEDYHLLQGARNEPLYRQFRAHLNGAGVPIEGTKGEAGVGQHEINVYHADALEAADRHVLLKQGVKEISMQNGYAVTFMAKPDHTWTGSSSHFHVSLWDTDNQRNVFDDPAGRQYGMSAAMDHFVAGLVLHARELSLFFAPYVNSYKRYAKASWAPTHVAWGADNRTCSLRVVGKGVSKRVENRLPGADVNPYLAAAAMIAAGLDGIERQLPLPQEWRGNAYAADDIDRLSQSPARAAQPLDSLPQSLHEAIRAFEQSDWACEAFGGTVHAHYLNAARVEQRAYDQVVTDWERNRYFEQA